MLPGATKNAVASHIRPVDC